MKCFQLIIFIYLFSIFRCNDEVEDEIKAYYGIPLGTIRVEEYGLKADAYAADEFTLSLQNFFHQPVAEGCISMIVGPPRKREKKSLKEGILLEMYDAHITPHFSSRKARQAIIDNIFAMPNWPTELDHLEISPDARTTKSVKQEDPFAGIQLDVGQQPGLPKNSKEILIGEQNDSDEAAVDSDFDNQLYEKIAAEERSLSEETVNNQNSTTKEANITPTELPFVTSKKKTTETTTGTKPSTSTTTTIATTARPKSKGASEKNKTTTTRKPKEETTPTSTNTKATATTTPKGKTITPRLDELNKTKAESDEKKKDHETTRSQKTTKIQSAVSNFKTRKPIIPTTTRPVTGVRQVLKTSIEQISTNRSSRLLQPIATKKETSLLILSASNRKNENFLKQKEPLTKGHHRTGGLLIEEPLDESGVVHFDDDTFIENDYHLNEKNEDQKILSHFHSFSASQGPGLIVINPDTGKIYDKDLVERRRYELLHSQSFQPSFATDETTHFKEMAEPAKPFNPIDFARTEDIKVDEDQKIPLLSDSFFQDTEFVSVSSQQSTTILPEITLSYDIIEDKHRPEKNDNKIFKKLKKTLRTETASPRVINGISIGRKFLLPDAINGSINFVLTNGAKLTSYKWLGLYDSCKNKVVPAIAIEGIDPPRIEKLSMLRHRSHNVVSRRIQILNCNTIMVPRFSYDSYSAPQSTYFYFGVGQFPDKIEKKIKAVVVGEPNDSPLRSFNHEDVLLRLPNNYRTFDVDFLTVFNDDEQKSYGHVTIPSLLVPPCNDDS